MCYTIGSAIVLKEMLRHPGILQTVVGFTRPYRNFISMNDSMFGPQLRCDLQSAIDDNTRLVESHFEFHKKSSKLPKLFSDILRKLHQEISMWLVKFRDYGEELREYTMEREIEKENFLQLQNQALTVCRLARRKECELLQTQREICKSPSAELLLGNLSCDQVIDHIAKLQQYLENVRCVAMVKTWELQVREDGNKQLENSNRILQEAEKELTNIIFGYEKRFKTYGDKLVRANVRSQNRRGIDHCHTTHQRIPLVESNKKQCPESDLENTLNSPEFPRPFVKWTFIPSSSSGMVKEVGPANMLLGAESELVRPKCFSKQTRKSSGATFTVPNLPFPPVTHRFASHRKSAGQTEVQYGTNISRKNSESSLSGSSPSEQEINQSRNTSYTGDCSSSESTLYDEIQASNGVVQVRNNHSHNDEVKLNDLSNQYGDRKNRQTFSSLSEIEQWDYWTRTTLLDRISEESDDETEKDSVIHDDDDVVERSSIQLRSAVDSFVRLSDRAKPVELAGYYGAYTTPQFSNIEKGSSEISFESPIAFPNQFFDNSTEGFENQNAGYGFQGNMSDYIGQETSISNLVTKVDRLTEKLQANENKIQKYKAKCKKLARLKSKNAENTLSSSRLKSDIELKHSFEVNEDRSSKDDSLKIAELKVLISNLSSQNENHYHEKLELKNLLRSYQNDLVVCIKELSKPVLKLSSKDQPSKHADKREWIKYSKNTMQVANDARKKSEKLRIALKAIKKQFEKLQSENSNLQSQLDAYANFQAEVLREYFAPSNKPRSECLKNSVRKYKRLARKYKGYNEVLTRQNEEALRDLILYKEWVQSQDEELAESICRSKEELVRLEVKKKKLKGTLEMKKSEVKQLANQLTTFSFNLEEYKQKLEKCEADLMAAQKSAEKPSTKSIEIQCGQSFTSHDYLNLPAFSQAQPECQSNSAFDSKASTIQEEIQNVVCYEGPNSADENIRNIIAKIHRSIEAIKTNSNRSISEAGNVSSNSDEIFQQEPRLERTCMQVILNGISSLNFGDLLYLNQAVLNAGNAFRKGICGNSLSGLNQK
ncbi:unnamed protein product [Hermetia illucens]|uniref:Uncharacterized protein n=2 Tax=Hermetia illucens TaxID=343691 RepID=A0A7R8UQ49_HERIL|nr:unnamed protein product [Hermetia illucens]